MLIGYVSPSSIRLPWELMEMLPDGVRVAATTLRVRGYTDAQFAQAQAGVAEAVEVLAAEGANAIIQAGVPVAVRGGYAQEHERLAELRQRHGVPLISGVRACVAGFDHLGVRRPLVATAYLEEMNRQLVEYFAEAGLQPAGVGGLGAQSPAESGHLPADALARLVRELWARTREADGVFLGARIQLQALAVALEAELGVPVLYGTQASVWWATRELQLSGARGGGRLLGDG
jgi:maleate cis-trans isomerase